MSRNRRVAISDSSPLILYAAIGRFHLLNAVFDEILIPPAVWDEVVNEGDGRPGSYEAQSANWIQIHTPSLGPTRTQVGLDRGELEELFRSLWISIGSTGSFWMTLLLEGMQKLRVYELSEAPAYSFD